VSYIEIYNECVNDLLDASRKNLSVRENQQGRAVIEGLSEFEVHSLEDTMHYLMKGDEQRKIAETRLNEKSSRSHTVFKISLYLSEKNLSTGRSHIKTAQINLVDLAGSEAVSKTHSEGMRFREGSNINKSLLALSRVIQMLGLKYATMNNAVKPNTFINFRDSKLTRIL
jgi:PHD/YefM family antitoxin component YafN of YafNO toxin-antitoxin module